ncbi:hypothetical protein WAI453_007226 [Rhynchosporium graminicola]
MNRETHRAIVRGGTLLGEMMKHSVNAGDRAMAHLSTNPRSRNGCAGEDEYTWNRVEEIGIRCIMISRSGSKRSEKATKQCMGNQIDCGGGGPRWKAAWLQHQPASKHIAVMPFQGSSQDQPLGAPQNSATRKSNVGAWSALALVGDKVNAGCD